MIPKKLPFACLSVCILLSICIYFLYRGYNWPFGIQGFEALGACGILVVTLAIYVYITRIKDSAHIRERSLNFGLIIGLVWTIEIAMNNILTPPLPARDIYDDIFWTCIALLILAYSIYCTYKTKTIILGIRAGAWSGFATGIIACLTALVFIVFGMQFILHDPLNIAEWAQRGPTSGTPNIAVYFVYQTLAGAIMHLVILGVIMGFLLGVVGGIVGKLYIIARSSLLKGQN